MERTLPKKNFSKLFPDIMKQNGAMTIAVQVVLIGLFTLKVYLIQKIVSSDKISRPRDVGCQTMSAPDESPTSWCSFPSRESSTETLSLTEDEDDDRQVPKLTFSMFACGEDFSDLSSSNSESESDRVSVSVSFSSVSSGVSDSDSDSDSDVYNFSGGLPDYFFDESPLAFFLNKYLSDDESEGK